VKTAGGVAQVVECLPNKQQAQAPEFNPQYSKKKKKKRERERK
jgi:hypothetical protein